MRTIAAVSTPNTMGGVAMIRISGDDALVIAGKVFEPSNSDKNIENMKGYTAAHGNICDGGAYIDEGVLLVYRAPRSYTGENIAEICCHGGVYVARRVLQACVNAGAVLAEPGEFTKRAVLNGKMTLTQAESVNDIIRAAGEQYLACANAQKSGALYRRINDISEKILAVSAAISAWVDYPEEDGGDFDINAHLQPLNDCRRELKELLDSYDIAEVMREGVVTAIVGKPNAGKSTLMNLMSRKQRSIVTDIPGTTRDIIEETVNIGGALLRLCDCAGIRETEDVAEQIGIEYMFRQIDESSLIIAVFDGSRPVEKDDIALIERIKGKNCICVINKSDLEQVFDENTVFSRINNQTRTIRLCAKQPDSFQKLSDVINDIYNINSFDLSAGFVANERQRGCVAEAEELLSQAVIGVETGAALDGIGFLLENVLDALYRLSGKNAGEEIVDEVFRRFCVGK